MFANLQNSSPPSPNIKVENLGSHLFCSINYLGKNYECKISVDELHSGMMSLLKLQNILKSYETIIQNPHYQFKFEIHENERTSTKHLILHIVFSDDYIDWEEKIYFREKCIVEQEEVENNLLKQQVQMQQKQIEKLENIIQNLVKRLDIVENDILINFKYFDIGCRNVEVMIPKKVNQLNFNMRDNYRSLDFITGNHMINYTRFETSSKIFSYNKITDFGKKLAEFDCDKIVLYYSIDYNFLDYYLSYKKNVFIVNTIEVNKGLNDVSLKQYLDVLVKYANYKKLIFPFNKEFNDKELKTHCETNGIEYICE